MKLKLLIVLSIFFVETVICQNIFYNVKDFGAVGDGLTLETVSIQKTIDQCAITGGTVYLPPGKYLTGSLELKSNVGIHLSAGAIILGSTNISDYKEFIPQMKSYNDAFLKHSIFYAEKAENISLRGQGVIDGQGSAFIVTTREKPDRYKNRPYVIRFVECKNVKVEDITMQNSAMWMQQYLACEDLFIRRIRVYNHANQNNDMMDIDGCKNVIISDCIGDTDDDGITLKSTSFRVTENVVITNCIISSHCNAIKLGTESHGGFKNISISNVVVKPSADTDPIYGHPKGISGITLGMVDGGVLEGVTISNIRIEGTHVPIYMRLGNRARKFYEDQPEPGVGIFRDVLISNIIATDVQSSIGCSITGIPDHYVNNVTLTNISIEFFGGGTKEDSKKIIPELEDHYPESNKWGTLPSFGFFIRHAKNINLNNVELRLKNPDARPAIIADDVEDLKITGLKVDSDLRAKNVITLRDVNNCIIQSSSVRTSANTFVELEGNKSKNIAIVNNVLVNVKKVINSKSKSKIKEAGNIL